MKKITIHTLQEMKNTQQKIAVLTVYDASFAHLFSKAGVEALLVGDTLGMVFAGRDSTVPVTIEQSVYHTECVARGNQGALVMGDMPFMSYSDPQKALNNAARLMQAGAEVIKMEGDLWLAETVSMLTARGIPVCVHLGLTPQSVHAFGGYKVQGRQQDQALAMQQAASTLEDAGARLLVLECVPHPLATTISQSVHVPVIGIGAGSGCDGQVLVSYDLLGISPHFKAKFVKNFMCDGVTIEQAIKNYVQEVKEQRFPAEEHCFV
jgi:3-methyl-2-oxobutanoate hydroxymethyltransferase